MRKLLFFSFLLVGYFPAVSQKTSASAYLIKAGKMYDAQNNRFVANQEILVVGDKIQAVGTRLKVPKNTQILDASKGTVTPGLIDAHTHLLFTQKQSDGMEVGSKIPAPERLQQGKKYADELLQVGFTTLRDLGNSGQFLDVQLQKQLKQSATPAPDFFVSGPIISPPGGQFNKLAPADTFVIKQEYLVVTNAREASQAVQELAQKHVNVVKVCMDANSRTLGEAEIKAIVQTAKQKNIPVTAHSTSDRTARIAVLAGVNGIEHGYSLSDSTLQLMGQRGVYLVPTDISREKAMLMVTGIGMKGKEAEEHANSFLTSTHNRIQKARQYQVKIVAGSDFYNDMASISRPEGTRDILMAYLEAGLSPAEVLQTATINAATALQINNTVGILKKGMKADIVIFNGDLENNFTQVFTDVNTVIKSGQQVTLKNKE